MKSPTYDLRPCGIDVVEKLCRKFHGYSGAGGLAAYAFAVFEDGKPVAAFAWQPPAPGAARAVCPEFPQGVLALSRMVAVPKSERSLRHISRPLRLQMKRLIDRGRWPVLITYHDEGQGHTGHVYKCSGWQKTARSTARTFTVRGRRVSSYNGGKSVARGRAGKTTLQRWEHWICDRGDALKHARRSGLRRIAIKGKVWKSGSQAYRWTR